MSLQKLVRDLEAHKDPVRANHLSRFFKTGVGEYGEGDQFLGLVVPILRQAVRKYWSTLQKSDLHKLLLSQYHELRLTGLLALVRQYEKADLTQKTLLYHFYLSHLSAINNWDLVDLTAPNIVGDYLLTHPRDLLYEFVKSGNLWERRIAILSTFTFIRAHDYRDSIVLAKILLHDPHDLIHKAVGWMLREIGKRDEKILLAFLDDHASHMPRTMLRYAIEKLSPGNRTQYLSAKTLS